MLTLFGKKKITEDKLANAFVNGIMQVVDNSFSEVVGLINDDPEFQSRPNLSEENAGKFLMIVITGNLNYLPNYFDNEQEQRIKLLVIEKFAPVFGMDEEAFYKQYKEYKEFMYRVNHPSKNILYAMSKAVFHKYQLNQYQTPYFRDMKSPNPLFLKRMDEVMILFLWDWNNVMDKYKLTGS